MKTEDLTKCHETSHPEAQEAMESMIDLCRDGFMPHMELTVRQRKALTLLMAGHNDTFIARAIGCRRETVNRWRNENASFQIALERLRLEAWQQARHRIERLADRALDVIERHIKDGSLPAAISILRGCGMFDPALIRRDLDWREQFLSDQAWAQEIREFREALRLYTPTRRDQDEVEGT